MAQQPPRKAPPSKPITDHPLFPAFVALWFSAVLGLGSLAVRPELLESLVLRSGIDLIVPAAAPPLGIMARILVALVLAATGSMLGIVVARKLARPGVAERDRNRTMHGSETGEQPLRHRDAHPDAPARRPISAREELGEELSAAPAAIPNMAQRRPSLTLADEETQYVAHESAPLIAAPMDLDAFIAASVAQVPLAVQEQTIGMDIAVWLPANQAWQSSSALPVAEPPLDTQVAFDDEDISAPTLLAAPSLHPDEAAPATRALAAAETTTPREAAARDGRQVFGMSPVEPQAAEDRQIFGMTPPSFLTPAEPAGEAAAAAPESATDTVSDEAPRANLAELGMVDLAGRLQESLARRRAARAAMPSAPPTAEPSSLLPPPRIAFAPESVGQEHIALIGPDVADRDNSEPDDGLSEIGTGGETSYASLLKMQMEGQVRNPHVRSNETETPADAAQPVVIFPGQASRIAILGSESLAAGFDSAASFRRFDSPVSAESGQPIALTAAASSIDPDEAERALRAALFSLQRISGAA